MRYTITSSNSESMLTLTSASPSDTATYGCFLILNGSEERRVNYTESSVQVQFGPIMEGQLRPMEVDGGAVDAGQNFELVCRVDGEPKPTAQGL